MRGLTPPQSGHLEEAWNHFFFFRCEGTRLPLKKLGPEYALVGGEPGFGREAPPASLAGEICIDGGSIQVSIPRATLSGSSESPDYGFRFHVADEFSDRRLKTWLEPWILAGSLQESLSREPGRSLSRKTVLRSPAGAHLTLTWHPDKSLNWCRMGIPEAGGYLDFSWTNGRTRFVQHQFRPSSAPLSERRQLSRVLFFIMGIDADPLARNLAPVLLQCWKKLEPDKFTADPGISPAPA